jgi:hypothetical protein
LAFSSLFSSLELVETGRCRAKIKADMSGHWNARVSYDGSRGKGQASFSLNVKQ